MQLVVDWDGTVTVRDSLLMVVEAFGDASLEPEFDAALAEGRMTHREVMEAEFATVRARLDEVVAYVVARAEVRPGLGELVARFDPLVLSSSFHETIEPVLAREGVAARVRANRVDPRPDGWRIRWESDSECDVCGQPCKRGALPPGPVVYVGDGFSDRCAALAAERVFARAGLASYLHGEGVPYERFETLHDVAAALS
ncbi:MAG TPA: haloacid dehalogenase-like hydrolase [Gaiellaceae bacterium]|nr:haloacid dehalogenase-like hydrolase [Gaiellaceae bacterium]